MYPYMGIDIEKFQPQPYTNCAHGYDVMRTYNLYIYIYTRKFVRGKPPARLRILFPLHSQLFWKIIYKQKKI